MVGANLRVGLTLKPTVGFAIWTICQKEICIGTNIIEFWYRTVKSETDTNKKRWLEIISAFENNLNPVSIIADLVTNSENCYTER